MDRRIRGILAVKHEIAFGDWFHIFYTYGVGDWLGALYKTKKVDNRDILEFADGADAKIMKLLAELPLEEVEKIVDYLEAKYNEIGLRRLPLVETPLANQLVTEKNNLKELTLVILDQFLSLPKFSKDEFFKSLNVDVVRDYDSLSAHLDDVKDIAQLETIRDVISLEVEFSKFLSQKYVSIGLRGWIIEYLKSVYPSYFENIETNDFRKQHGVFFICPYTDEEYKFFVMNVLRGNAIEERQWDINVEKFKELWANMSDFAAKKAFIDGIKQQ